MLVLATAYERGGSIELAEKQYADATKISNFDARVTLSYVAFLRRRGSIERAEDILNELASRWPNDISILSALADVKLLRTIGLARRRLPTRSAVSMATHAWPIKFCLSP